MAFHEAFYSDSNAFVPPRLSKGKEWVIVFWAIDPHSGQMRRKRIKFNHIQNKKEREKAARELMAEITHRLSRGWNPWIQGAPTRSFVLISEAMDLFLSTQERLLQSGALRPDTLRDYRSRLKNFREWMGEKTHDYTTTITRQMIREFLDHLLFERQNAPRTVNNYLSFLHTLLEFMVQKEFLSKNPAMGIKKLREGQKQRKVIPGSTLERILDHLKTTDPGYGVLCRMILDLFIRRKELTMLRVSDVSIERSLVRIDPQIAKNGQESWLTIPGSLLSTLKEHIRGAAATDFLFSKGFFPGPTPIAPKLISDRWVRLRKDLSLPAQYQFYSLKDTGITAMIEAGVPISVVRDQARHHDISITDRYTPRHMNKGHRSILDR